MLAVVAEHGRRNSKSNDKKVRLVSTRYISYSHVYVCGRIQKLYTFRYGRKYFPSKTCHFFPLLYCVMCDLFGRVERSRSVHVAWTPTNCVLSVNNEHELNNASATVLKVYNMPVCFVFFFFCTWSLIFQLIFMKIEL